VRNLRSLLLASTVVVAMVGGCLVYGWSRGARAPTPERAVAELEVAPFAVASVAALASSETAPSSAPGRDGLAARVDRLSRSTDALVGVHHAAAEMLLEGPDGLGIGTSGDIDAPQNADWKQRIDAAVEAGVHTCDPEALDSRVNSYENGSGVQQDRGKALTYWIAYVDCRKRLDGSPTKILGNGDSVTERMGDTLSADQVAAAVSAGEQLARDARPLPGDR
jgi:hypothetical protein